MKRLSLVIFATSLIMIFVGQTMSSASGPGSDESHGFPDIELSNHAKGLMGEGRAEKISQLVREMNDEELKAQVDGLIDEFPADREIQIFCRLALGECLDAKYCSRDPGDDAREKISEAEYLLEEAVKLALMDSVRFRPHLAQSYFLLGGVYHVLGDYGRALEAEKKLALEYNGVGTGEKKDFLAEGGLNRIRQICLDGGLSLDEGIGFFKGVYEDRYKGQELGLVTLKNMYILQYDAGRYDDALMTLDLIDSKYPDNDFTKTHKPLLRKVINNAN